MRSATRYALDGGVLIALALGDPSANKLRESIEEGVVEACTSSLALLEMAYILCRRLGWEVAKAKLELLRESRAIEVVELSEVVEEASKIKCERAISVADCCTLALAKLRGCKGLFAKRERELEKEERKKPFDVEIEYLVKGGGSYAQSSR